jgi:hypothetical protein
LNRNRRRLRRSRDRDSSQYSYGFPVGNGDCNCITWLERLGLPLLTGRMDEFIGLPGFVYNPSRRFGECKKRGITTMSSIPPSVAQDEQRLGGLAMKFRGTRSEAERADIARDYAET